MESALLEQGDFAHEEEEDHEAGEADSSDGEDLAGPPPEERNEKPNEEQERKEATCVVFDAKKEERDEKGAEGEGVACAAAVRAPSRGLGGESREGLCSSPDSGSLAAAKKAEESGLASRRNSPSSSEEGGCWGCSPDADSALDGELNPQSKGPSGCEAETQKAVASSKSLFDGLSCKASSTQPLSEASAENEKREDASPDSAQAEADGGFCEETGEEESRREV